MFTKSRLLDEELSSNSGKLVRKSLSRAMLLRRRMEVERLSSLASIESFSMSEIRRCVLFSSSSSTTTSSSLKLGNSSLRFFLLTKLFEHAFVVVVL